MFGGIFSGIDSFIKPPVRSLSEADVARAVPPASAPALPQEPLLRIDFGSPTFEVVFLNRDQVRTALGALEVLIPYGTRQVRMLAVQRTRVRV
jgi:hypothetical protein